jgi:hypothetical protein
MAIGDDALAAGFTLVNGASGLVKDGDDEINKTRDYIAQVKNLIQSVWPISAGGTGATTAAGARTNLGLKGTITIDTANPTGGAVGDIWFKYTP